MSFRAAILSLALAALAAPFPASAQEPTPKTALTLFKDAQDQIAGGNYALAAETLQAFLDAAPTDPQFQEIEGKYGATVFQRLQNVLKWSDNKAENAKAVAVRDQVIKKSLEATKRTFGNPARIASLVQKLGSFREERLFAEKQLILANMSALPQLLSTFRTTNKPELQASIVSLLSRMPIETVPGQVATLDTLPDAEKLLILTSLMNREDVLKLVETPETNFLPYLWHFAGEPAELKSMLREKAIVTLEQLLGPSARKTRPEEALTELAVPITAGKATYRHQDPLDQPNGLVRVWTYANNTLKSQDVPRPVADEYFALKYLRWALERNPKHLPAQKLFTTFATERAVERAKFGDLSKTEPAVYQLLAAAPSAMLTELLETGLAGERTALVIGTLQALGDRAHRDGATAPREPGSVGVAENSSPFVRALSYSDARVQFLAAIALLRQPGAPTHGKQARVVEILKQALSAEADGSGTGTVGRALITDPNPIRGEGLAQMFRDAGYAAERYASGRQLVARLAKANDYDLIVVDRHVVDPLLNDTLHQLAADTNAARRPVFVVASSDKPKTLPVELLLLRLANLVAATDDGVIKPVTGFDIKPIQIVIPEPYAFNPMKPDKDREQARLNIVLERDRGMIGPSDADRQEAQKSGRPQPKEGSLLIHRLERLKKLVEAADLPTTADFRDRLTLRLPQLVVAGLAAEFEATPETAPRTVERLEQATRNLVARRELNVAAAEIPDLGNLMRLMEQLDAKLSPAQKEKFRTIQNRMRPATLALPTDSMRDTELEGKLATQLKRNKGVHMLSEPFAAEYLKSDIEQAVQNPAQKPRDPAERLATATVAAQWFRKLALGEVAGYDVRPAETELRNSLRTDATAEYTVDAVARLASKQAQEDLINLSLNGGRPAALRLKAADAAVRHVQQFGKLADVAITEQLAVSAAAEKDLPLQAKFGVLSQLLSGNPADFGGVLRKVPVRLAFPEAPKAPMPKDPKDPPEKEPKEPPKM